MGSKAAAVDHTPAASDTDIVSAYDESFSISEDGRVIPVTRGARKVAARFVMCAFLRQRVVDVKNANSSGGGK